MDSIFPYLPTRDLCSASVAFKMFSLSIMTSDLWIDLEKRIYSLPYEDVNGAFDLAMTNYRTADDRALRHQSAKEKCARSMLHELRIARGRAVSMDSIPEIETAKRCVRHSLDVIVLPLTAPLSFLLLFLAVLLFAQHFDGSDSPLWVCAIPLELLFFYCTTVFSLARVFLAKVSQ